MRTLRIVQRGADVHEDDVSSEAFLAWRAEHADVGRSGLARSICSSAQGETAAKKPAHDIAGICRRLEDLQAKVGRRTGKREVRSISKVQRDLNDTTNDANKPEMPQ